MSQSTVFARFRRLSPLAVRPQHRTCGSAGADLASVETVEIPPGERRLVRTGLAVELPLGSSLLICPRSGMAVEHGVTVLNAPGVVDADFRGEIKIILVNLGSKPYKVEPGQRIAQALIVPIARGAWAEADSLGGTVRGDGGFGSTGE